MINGSQISGLISGSTTSTSVGFSPNGNDASIYSSGFFGLNNSPIVMGTADSQEEPAVQEESTTVTVPPTVAVGQEEVEQNKHSVVFSNDWPEDESLAGYKPVPTNYVIKTSDGRNLFQAGVSALVGKPKCGKSSFLYSIIADLTKGGGVFGHSQPSKVIFAEHEDPKSEIVKSLIASGAILGRVNFCLAQQTSDNKQNKIEVYLKRLEGRVAANPDCKLILVDSLGKIAPKLGFKLSSSGDIRLFVDGLQALGEKYSVAVVVINHFNKGSGAKTLDDQMAGSSQLFASIRALWVAGRHPERQDLRCISFYQGNISNPCEGVVFKQVTVSAEEVLKVAAENNIHDIQVTQKPKEFKKIELVNDPIVPPEQLVNPAKSGQSEDRDEEDEEFGYEYESDESESLPSMVSYTIRKKTRNTEAKSKAKAFVQWLVETLETQGEMLANEAEAEATRRGLKSGNYRKARKMAEAKGVCSRSKKVEGVKASYLFLENREITPPVAAPGTDSKPQPEGGFIGVIDKSFVFSAMA